LEKFKFNLQCHSVILPTNPSTSAATVGKDYLLSIATGELAAIIWTLVGGQRSSNLSRKADSIDVSHKTSGGWKSTKAGLKEWSIDLSGLALLQDAGLEALEQAFNASQDIYLKFKYPDGTYRTGWASITELSIENPHDGAATLKGTLSGIGALSELQTESTITPLVATFSKATAADATFSITPTTSTITSVKNGSVTLNATTDYTYSAGALVIKSAYLTTLTNGVATLAIDVGTGSNLSIAITVAA
jgi:TP901-1 family phage major tail protein